MPSFNLLSDAVVAPRKEFNLLSDAVVAPPNDFELLSDALVLPASAFAKTSDAMVCDAPICEFDPIPAPSEPVPDYPSDTASPFLCDKAINQCLPCNDDPVLNTSAEIADVDRYIGVIPEYEPDPPITGDPTKIFFSFGCLGLCYSTISQEDADQCAANQAKECIGDSPGGDTPTGNPRGTFSSTAQSCSDNCVGGGTFIYSLAAGAVLSFFSQADANARAFALACKLGKLFKLCLTITGETSGCVNSYMSFIVNVTGPLTQFPFPSQWSVGGPGIDPNVLSYNSGPSSTLGTTSIQIFGTPTIQVDTYVIVRITDNNTGSYMERQIPVTIEQCSGEWGNVTPDIFSGTVSYWNSGEDIPAGTYRISYVNGALGFGYPGLWYVNADDVSPTNGHPGAGFHISRGGGDLFFPTNLGIADVVIGGLHYGRALFSQGAIEAAYGGLSIIFTHTGGPIGMYLWDSPYTDNIAGSPTPTFNLSNA